MRNSEIKCVSNVFKNGDLKTTSTGKQVLNVSFPYNISVLNESTKEYVDVFPPQWVSVTLWDENARHWNKVFGDKKSVSARICGTMYGEIYQANDGTMKTRLKLAQECLSYLSPRDNQGGSYQGAPKSNGFGNQPFQPTTNTGGNGGTYDSGDAYDDFDF